MAKINTARDSSNYIGTSTLHDVIVVYVGDNNKHVDAWINVKEAKELVTDLQKQIKEVEGKFPCQ